GASMFWPGLTAPDRGAEFPFEKGRFKRLTDNGIVSLAALSPDGTRFAYVTNDRGRQGLYAGDVSGGSNIELRQPSEEEYFDIGIASDGSGLYYSSRPNAYGATALYRIPLLGGPAEKIRDDVRFFDLSPDAQTVAFTAAGGKESAGFIAKAPIASGEASQLISLPGPIDEKSLAWSADGGMLAFAANSE